MDTRIKFLYLSEPDIIQTSAWLNCDQNCEMYVKGYLQFA